MIILPPVIRLQQHLGRMQLQRVRAAQLHHLPAVLQPLHVLLARQLHDRARSDHAGRSLRLLLLGVHQAAGHPRVPPAQVFLAVHQVMPIHQEILYIFTLKVLLVPWSYCHLTLSHKGVFLRERERFTKGAKVEKSPIFVF